MNHYGVEELKLEEGDIHARLAKESGFKTEFQERLRQKGQLQYEYPLTKYVQGLTWAGQKGCSVRKGNLKA